MSQQWECHPKAEGLLIDLLEKCCKESHFISNLQDELKIHTSTRLFDWIDHFVINDKNLEKELEKAGFETLLAGNDYRLLYHPGAQLPRVAVKDRGPVIGGCAVKVECIADFLMVRGMTGWIEGTPYSLYRRCSIHSENQIILWAVERRAGHTIEPVYTGSDAIERYLESKEKWQTRSRSLENEDEDMEKALQIAQELVGILGQDLAAWVVLEGERSYWQARNTAGQIQKNRQDRLGMGWANHDHHTFRSSRKLFPKLVRLFEILGFHCRERFYAGDEAGWGAQVMENPRAGLVLFLDLDLAPHELHVDFAHENIPSLPKLRTVGLWCALHGDSVLKGGMHHLEAQFSFEELTHDLHEHGIGMMDPFSNFPYLKQAFTHGEIWTVDQKRVKQLQEEGFITQEEAEKFSKYGAVGSHMENLQRREGYKGFNQKNVSYIITKTDPRNA